MIIILALVGCRLFRIFLLCLFFLDIYKLFWLQVMFCRFPVPIFNKDKLHLFPSFFFLYVINSRENKCGIAVFITTQFHYKAYNIGKSARHSKLIKHKQKITFANNIQDLSCQSTFLTLHLTTQDTRTRDVHFPSPQIGKIGGSVLKVVWFWVSWWSFKSQSKWNIKYDKVPSRLFFRQIVPEKNLCGYCSV